jgi:hypothetical protein
MSMKLTILTAFICALALAACGSPQNGMTPALRDVATQRNSHHVIAQHRAPLAKAHGGVWLAYAARYGSVGLPTSLLYLRYPYTKISVKITSGVSDPVGIAACSAKGVVAAADSNNNTVVVYSDRGAKLSTVSLPNYTQPRAVAFDSTCDLAVLDDRYSSNILVYGFPYNGSPQTLTASQMHCSEGTYASCVTTDRHGNILFADSQNQMVRVWIRSANGSYKATPFNIKQLNNQQPYSLALDSKGNLYVGESDEQTIEDYAASSSPSQPYKTTPGRPFSTTTLPANYSFNGTDQLVVDARSDLLAIATGCCSSSEIAEFRGLSGNALPIEAGLYNTTAMALDSGQNLLVANQNDGTLVAYGYPYPIYPYFARFNVTYIGSGSVNAIAYDQ